MLKIESPRTQPMQAPAAFALWNLGFRPFYLLASMFAALSVALWACEYAGYVPAGYLRNPVWHGHEMLFGYTRNSGIHGANPAGAPGWFELANHGALFLDEIQSLSVNMQEQFFRVLEDKTVAPFGAIKAWQMGH